MRTKVAVPYLFLAFIVVLISASGMMGQDKQVNQKLVVGDLKIWKLQDAGIYLKLSLLSGIDLQDAMKLTGGRDSILTPVNAFLVQAPNHVILVDSGIGGKGGPNSGHLIEQMNAAGIAPSKVDLILITHFHFDHIGGLLTSDGKRLFPNAIIRAPQMESDFWLRDLSLIPAEQRTRAGQIKAALEPYILAKAYRTFHPDENLGNGIKALPAYGHTVGHTVYSFSSKGNEFWCIGDLIHFGDIQFKNPSAGVVFDTNSQMAIKERIEFFKQAAAKHVIIAGAHLPEMVHIEKAGNSFVVSPAITH
jgi:glyoxylase-like metal-dependent hydrolase (beta-lactamase superfamily II)